MQLPQSSTHSPKTFPEGPRTQINRVLGPKYHNINGIWALNPYYLGPIYPYIVPIYPYIPPITPFKGTLLFGSLDPEGTATKNPATLPRVKLLDDTKMGQIAQLHRCMAASLRPSIYPTTVPLQ